MTITEVHALFAQQDDAGDTDGWCFPPGLARPRESAPLCMAGLVKLSGIEPATVEEALAAAAIGLELIPEHRSQADWQVEIYSVLHALEAEVGHAAAADLN